MPRLFIAIPLPAEVKALLTSLRTVLPGCRWVEPDQMHLTLHFLGDIDDSLVPDLQTLVSQLTTAPFPLTTGSLGVFPTPRAPRVLWLGLSDSKPLQRLHAELSVGLARLGLTVEDRPFHPHLTLARLRDTPPAAVVPLLRQPPPPSLSFTVDRVILFASRLQPGGAIHQPQATGLLPDDPNLPPRSP